MQLMQLTVGNSQSTHDNLFFTVDIVFYEISNTDTYIYMYLY